jgi:hypothetical protein
VFIGEGRKGARSKPTLDIGDPINDPALSQPDVGRTVAGRAPPLLGSRRDRIPLGESVLVEVFSSLVLLGSHGCLCVAKSTLDNLGAAKAFT